MKGPTHNRFHFLAIRWLRDDMDVVTDTLPTNKVADAADPEHARIHGYVLPAGGHRRIGWIALMLLICAATLGMASIRPGLGTTLIDAMRVLALGTTALSVVLLVVDALRRRHLRRTVDMVIHGGANDMRVVDAASIERWTNEAEGQLWVVAERGFTDEALAYAGTHDVHCCVGGKRGFTELHHAAA
jgi:hypothetical protein